MNRRAPLFAGIGLAVVALLAVVLLVLPKMGDVGETQDQLTQAEDRETELQVQLQALQQAQAEAPETERQLAAIEDQVPTTADLPALFRLLQGAADRSAIDFFSLAPGTPTPDPNGGSFSVVPSQISVTGGYFALDEFLFLLETLPRAAKVTSVVISPGGATTTTGTTTSTSSLSMQLTVEFYTTDTSAGPGSVPGPSEPSVTGATGPTGATGATGATGEAAGSTGSPSTADDSGEAS